MVEDVSQECIGVTQRWKRYITKSKMVYLWAELRNEFVGRLVDYSLQVPKLVARGEWELCDCKSQIYIVGFDIGAIIPCLTITLGFVACWNDCLVIHSGPTGRRSERSYCCLDSKGCGSWEARYFSFCSYLALAKGVQDHSFQVYNVPCDSASR